MYVHAHGVQPMVPQSINFSSFGAGGMGGAGPFLFTHPNMQVRARFWQPDFRGVRGCTFPSHTLRSGRRAGL